MKRDWRPKAHAVLTLAEIDQVVRDLRYKGRRSPAARVNLAIFRLSTCCGLRAGEIAALRVRDVRLSKSRPYIEIRGTIATHSGRHTFASWALARGRGLVEVRDAVGHASIQTTNLYAHLVHDQEGVGRLFSLGPDRPIPTTAASTSSTETSNAARNDYPNALDRELTTQAAADAGGGGHERRRGRR